MPASPFDRQHRRMGMMRALNCLSISILFAPSWWWRSPLACADAAARMQLVARINK